MSQNSPLWAPDPSRVASSRISQFIANRVAEGALLPAVDTSAAFDALYRWSIQQPETFWSAVWRDADLIADAASDGSRWSRVLLGGERMAPPSAGIGPTWFLGASLNFAENLLRRTDSATAIIAWDEQGPLAELDWRVLRDVVRRAAGGLRALGVRPGDRVAGWVPNTHHAVVAMLAATSIGAVWTSCSPDFGVDGIVDRFGQTEPVVMIFCDGYRYGGKRHDCVERAAELLPRLPSVRHAVMISYAGAGQLPADERCMRWDDLLASGEAAPERFARLPFDHPLYIMYSSGTTGLPKCLVHSAGGTLLQHIKEHQLHVDLRADERLFYFTTCGWMMWNWQVSALASNATLVLYDGSPLPPDEPDLLWRLAAATRVNVFGTSAKYLALAEKHELRPGAQHDLSGLRSVLSTGSPLAPESFTWIARAVGPVQTASISGGTDILSCFVLGNPLQPVVAGEIQGPGLGMAVDVYDATGHACAPGTAGELVCTQPFPSMPIAFWNDPDGARYRAAYFERFPGVWCHGDWIARTDSGGFIITGRSDATLNPGGVRIGTAEIYRQVESIDAILESLVVGQRRDIEGTIDERIVLFVRMRPGYALDESLQQALRHRIRQGTSPHHVPRTIVAVDDIPRTRSGKLSELAVRDVIEGRPVQNVGALANPEALAQYREWARTAAGG